MASTRKPKAPEISTCSFSEEDPPLYRFALEHRWDPEMPAYARKTVTWLMLNPSTADGQSLDATLRRCRAFSKRLGAGGMIVVNLFSYRATRPADMLAAVDPIGVDNDKRIWNAATREDTICVVAGWGTHGAHRGRDRQVMEMLAGKLSCLGTNRDGSPKHPLYVKGDTPLQPYGLVPLIAPLATPTQSTPVEPVTP